MKKNKVFSPVGPSTWDLRTWPRRVARFARKTASTPSGPALTQVGRAPSLTLEALANSSSRENLKLWGLALRAGLECPEASPGLGRGQAGEGDRHSQARGRVRLGPAEWRRCPWVLALGGHPRSLSPHCGTRALSRGLGLSRSVPSVWLGLPTPPKDRLLWGLAPRF